MGVKERATLPLSPLLKLRKTDSTFLTAESSNSLHQIYKTMA